MRNRRKSREVLNLILILIFIVSIIVGLAMRDTSSILISADEEVKELDVLLDVGIVDNDFFYEMYLSVSNLDNILEINKFNIQVALYDKDDFEIDVLSWYFIDTIKAGGKWKGNKISLKVSAEDVYKYKIIRVKLNGREFNCEASTE